SLMTGLLEKRTRMKVVQAEDGLKVEPNHVYTKPPGKDLIIRERTLRLLEPKEGVRSQLPIDTFFRSLAEDLGERAICIILSGAGGDGTLGLKAVKGAGGMVMVQDEKQAEYDGMPRSAISTGLADFILPVERMPGELVSYATHPFLEPDGVKDETSEERFERFVLKALNIVRRTTGHDFSGYKRTTIRRRIGRRMAVNQIADISHYANYLRQNPAEVEELFRDLLINVTNFFRDPAAFEVVETNTIPALLAQKEPDLPVRLWVPGCGTGEEAYSLAMIFVEVMERLERHWKVQIFATDINPEAIETARGAIYPENIAADVTSERLRRFFKKDGDAYKVDRQLRDMVVFAIHDITRDPPLSRLDMISCRNLLIYMDAALQKKVVPLFYYGLVDQGILFLGTSEGVGDFHDLFETVDRKYKVFRARKLDPHAYRSHIGLYAKMPEAISRQGKVEPGDFPETTPQEVNIRRLVEQVILQKYAPPGVLVDDKFNVLYFHGDTSKYLKPPRGEATFDILRMTHEEMRYKLARALNRVKTQRNPIVFEGLRVRQNDEYLTVDLVLTPVEERTGRPNLVLVTFEEKTPAAEKKPKKAQRSTEETPDAQMALLQHDLDATRQELQATIEELETSNEELKSANEELQANNEELQSTNEELESSKEELQSINEELGTVNEELRRKNQELQRSEDDLSNLLNATDIAILYLDTKLSIQRFTPATTQIFNIRELDVGRPVSDITAQFDTELFAREVGKVAETLQKGEREVEGKNGRWFSMRMLPYRATENVISGVVVTFLDVTEQRLAQREVEAARVFGDCIIDYSWDGLLVLDYDLRVRSANQSYLRIFGKTKEETLERPFFEQEGSLWDVAELRQLLGEVIAAGREFTGFRVEADFPGIGRRVIHLRGRRIGDRDGLPPMILLGIQDVTAELSGQ
ncbi:MAG TPA: CheR family methyltransferase, partial [Syntrophobacteria bacterium]|nr:CheR family methyltransferase [Syntrophobacteria bacterium]